jgi:hypothetical protein
MGEALSDLEGRPPNRKNIRLFPTVCLSRIPRDVFLAAIPAMAAQGGQARAAKAD